MKANRLAAITVLALGGYLQLVEWVDIFPWNDVRNGNGQETLDYFLGGATVVLTVWLWFGGRIAASVAALAVAVWAGLQIQTWWIPYMSGASEGWKRVYAKWFSETISFLPRSTDRLPPDANHLALHLLLMTAFFTCLAALFQRGRNP